MNFGPHADTICALSTASGIGAIAVIRVSGPRTKEIVNTLFSKDLSDKKSHTVHFGNLVHQDVLIDEVVIALFEKGKSFTGEETAEISCHGSVFIQQKILEALLDSGCRMAEAGEFTMRAYMNGRFDLAQAEAIADLIASKSAAAHRMALTQMRGGVSQALANLREKLIDFVALIELELDFGEEDVEFADRSQLIRLINEIQGMIVKLQDSFQVGKAIKNGIPVAILGAPNVGKSTLLNALLKEEKAIVSDIPGTTRDFIEDEVILNGIAYRFIDTAGLRETEDHVESLGIERSYKKAKEAQVILFLIDNQIDNEKEIEKELNSFKNQYLSEHQKLLVVVNKSDLNPRNADFLQVWSPVFIAAKSGEHLDVLTQRISEITQEFTAQQGDILISNARHFDALQKANRDLETARLGIQNQLPTDLLAMDIRSAIQHIGSITGTVDIEEVLGSIFSKFCIGK